MIISDDSYYPILIDSIEVPTKTDYFWTLNLPQRDFMLSKLVYFEQITVKAFTLDIGGFIMDVPTYWNILVTSDETSQVDIVDFETICRGYFSAFIFNHKKNNIRSAKIRVVDYHDVKKIQTTFLEKTAMLCHAYGYDEWVCVSPTDNYNKYLKDAVIGDFI